MRARASGSRNRLANVSVMLGYNLRDRSLTINPPCRDTDEYQNCGDEYKSDDDVEAGGGRAGQVLGPADEVGAHGASKIAERVDDGNANGGSGASQIRRGQAPKKSGAAVRVPNTARLSAASAMRLLAGKLMVQGRGHSSFAPTLCPNLFSLMDLAELLA